MIHSPMYTSALKAYRRNHLETAPKTEILDRLFARLESDLRAGQGAIESGDIPARAHALDHAVRILTELISALDARSAPELCANLDALYRFVLACIGRASVERSAVVLDQPIQIVATLRTSFAEAATAP